MLSRVASQLLPRAFNAFINMKICPILGYEENKDWIPIFSSISYGIGAIVCGSWMYSIWKDARNQQKVWTIFGIFKAWTKILVIFECTTEMFLSLKVIFVFVCVLLDNILLLRSWWIGLGSNLGNSKPRILFFQEFHQKSTNFDDCHVPKFHHSVEILCLDYKISSRNGWDGYC